MLLRTLFICLITYSNAVAQDLKLYDPVKAEPAGGVEQIEQLIETQLELPKNLLTSGYREDLKLYFLLDSAGNACKFLFDKTTYNKAIKKELIRITKLLKFERVFPDPLLPYYINYSLSAEKYKHYFKQKNKFKILSPMPADTSGQVYKKADKSPTFYKNADEGLSQLLLDELEYPKAAMDRSIQGTVIVEFIVEPNGFVTNVIAKQKISAGCTEEALRLMKITRWQPAELQNKLIRYKMTYPITFNLRIEQSKYSAGTIGQ